MNENHKQKSLATIDELKCHLAAICAEVADAQETLEKLPSQLAEPSLAGRLVTVSVPPPYVIPSGEDEYRLTLTGAHFLALNRAVAAELHSFAANDYPGDTPTYRSTLTELYHVLCNAEQAFLPCSAHRRLERREPSRRADQPTPEQAAELARQLAAAGTPAELADAAAAPIRLPGYDPSFTPDPENFGNI